MEASDLEIKLQILKSEKRLLWWRLWWLHSLAFCIAMAPAVVSLWLELIDPPYETFFSIFLSFIGLMGFSRYVTHIKEVLMPIEQSVKQLAEQIEEETTAHRVAEFAEKIRTSKIRPDLNLRQECNL